MTRFVAVRLRASPPHPCGPPSDTPPDLSLRIRSAGRHHDVLARVGLTVPGGQPGTDGRVSGADVHFAVDAGLYPGTRWPACADVLHDRHPRPFVDTARLLSRLMAAHPGCRLAAAPLTGGGWAVAERTSRTVVPVAAHVPPDRPLLASCLHAWLVAGHALRDIEDVRVLDGT
ncbi:hypothetical protein ACWD0J_13565 [Streptomyces sp. NPDC003011]